MSERLNELLPDAYAPPEPASSLCEVSGTVRAGLRGAGTTIDLP